MLNECVVTCAPEAQDKSKRQISNFSPLAEFDEDRRESRAQLLRHPERELEVKVGYYSNFGASLVFLIEADRTLDGLGADVLVHRGENLRRSRRVEQDEAGTALRRYTMS